MKATHAVNAELWHPGEQAQNYKQTDKQTNQRTTIPAGRGTASVNNYTIIT